MTNPDFPRRTVETLARRARFQCSNPDCGAQTVGPNSDPNKATTIGEAAHIHGAKLGSMRFSESMSDVTRAAITNGIWLCRNCHGLIDRDAAKYPPDLLFSWRAAHEKRVLHELGSAGDRIRLEMEMGSLDFLKKYSPIIQRIAIDKPDGWEWRFTAELMRNLCKPQFKRLKNLQSEHYFQPQASVSPDTFIDWLRHRTDVMGKIMGPLGGLLHRLTESWGAPGKPGDIEEMHDVCVLIRDLLSVMVDHEEALRFSHIPDEGEELRAILVDAVGKNAEKLTGIPEKLDEMIAMIGTEHTGTVENPLVVRWELIVDLPENFNRDFDDALQRYEKACASSQPWF